MTRKKGAHVEASALLTRQKQQQFPSSCFRGEMMSMASLSLFHTHTCTLIQTLIYSILSLSFSLSPLSLLHTHKLIYYFSFPLTHNPHSEWTAYRQEVVLWYPVWVFVPEIGDEIAMTLYSPYKFSSKAIQGYNYRFYRDGKYSECNFFIKLFDVLKTIFITQ